MPDKRSVDDLSIAELERILAIKKRQARQQQLRRMRTSGRVIPTDTGKSPASAGATPPLQPSGTSTRPHFEDTIAPGDYIKQKNDRAPEIWRRFVDRSLFLVEIIAVVGLVIVGVAMFQGIGELQQETASAQQRADEQIRAAIPTIEPTPVLQLASIVLPGGHIPPTEPGGGQFNFDEIPASLRDQVRSQLMMLPELERPPITPETARRIIIPDIGVDQVIVQGADHESLKLGVGQVLNGTTPGDDGNLVLAAHNDIYGEIFRYLDQLEPGMEFEVHTEKQIYSYVITGQEIVNPNDVHVMDYQGRPTATLISCYPYQVNNKRIIITADRINT